MAMGLFSIFKHSGVRSGGLVSVFLVLSATAAHAGFEWVPAEPQAAAPAPVEAVPMQPPAQDLLMYEGQPLSPLPPLDMEEPDMGAQPQTAVAPAPAIKTQTPPSSQNVLKVKTMDGPSPSIAPAPPEIMPQEPVQAPVTAEIMTPPPAPRIILPEDAPSSARNAAAKSGGLQINPWPVKDKSATPLPPLENASTPVAREGAMPIQANTMADAEQEAVGFGKDMPLALALQQIAPPGYAFSFGENINPGMKVSWTGGRAWSAVMDDMIAPLGLQASIRGKAIFIHHQKQSALREPLAQSPVALEPSAGEDEIAAGMPATMQAETGAQVRRKLIQDPGAVPQLQSQDTLDTLEASPGQGVQKSGIPEKQTGVWEAEKGDSLKQTLSAWSRKGAFDLEWNASHDYALISDVLVAGKVDQALKVLLLTGVGADNAPALTYVDAADNSSDAKLIIDDQKNPAS
ncbi:MAG: TcpQ domain-containing protein [Alphaproteobacteria bacterium]